MTELSVIEGGIETRSLAALARHQATSPVSSAELWYSLACFANHIANAAAGEATPAFFAKLKAAAFDRRDEAQ
jgi:hypothetical protein